MKNGSATSSGTCSCLSDLHTQHTSSKAIPHHKLSRRGPTDRKRCSGRSPRMTTRTSAANATRVAAKEHLTHVPTRLNVAVCERTWTHYRASQNQQPRTRNRTTLSHGDLTSRTRTSYSLVNKGCHGHKRTKLVSLTGNTIPKPTGFDAPSLPHPRARS